MNPKMPKKIEKAKIRKPIKKEPYSLMNKGEYAVMFNVEEDYWWYKALHHMILRLVRKETSGKNPTDIKLLDCGCGTGGMLATLKPRYPWVTGFDLSEDAVKFCHKRGFKDIKKMSVTEISYPKNHFNIVYSLDVLCNLELKDFSKALKGILSTLKPEGIFIFNLPAFNSMQSEHDRAVGIFRRFRRNTLKKELEAAGFEVEKINYRVSCLFPLIWIIRLLKKGKKIETKEAHSDLKPLPAPVNGFLTGLFKMENVIVSCVPSPFGLSVFGVARKRGK
jgi:SAM-dependent methyltransferase